MSDHLLTSVEQLEAITAAGRSRAVKECRINPPTAPSSRRRRSSCWRRGAGGLDCSPRGDAPGFVRRRRPHAVLPDRRGNNRIDSLRNIVRDPRVSLLFLVPGVGETLRVIGRAGSRPSRRCSMGSSSPARRRARVILDVERVYFQCTKALVRSKLWDAYAQVDRTRLPSTGTFSPRSGRASG